LLLNLGYCYNADNSDGSGAGYTYGSNPPAFGFDLLRSPITNNTQLNATAFCRYQSAGNSPIVCERPPNPDVQGAYNYLRGFKLDQTPWVNPLNMQTTKFCFSGDPESNTGWTEFRGSVQNCGGSLTGSILPIDPPSDSRFTLNTGSDNLYMMPNDTQTIVVAQMIARGTNNLNSVTKLKQLSATVQNFYNNNVGVNNISSTVPASFSLYQNYPNPFNPATNIKFDIVRNENVTLKIYDAAGKEVATLINNEMVSAGTNEVSFDAKNMASGIYFYGLTAGTFTDTKRMVLIK